MTKNEKDKIEYIINLYDTKDLVGLKCVTRVENRMHIHKKMSLTGLILIGLASILVYAFFGFLILKWQALDQSKPWLLYSFISIVACFSLSYVLEVLGFIRYKNIKFVVSFAIFVLSIIYLTFFVIAYQFNFFGVTYNILDHLLVFIFLLGGLFLFLIGLIVIKSIHKTITRANHNYYKKYDKKLEKQCLEVQNILKRADASSPEIMYYKGMCLFYGIGEEVNHSGAYSYFEKAYEEGYRVASCKLGLCLISGYGVLNKNIEKGLALLQEADELNMPEASEFLARLYYNGQYVKEDKEKSDMLFLKAADNGNKEAQYGLAVSNLFSEGALQNLPEAYKWLEKAGEQGHQKAIYSLGQVYLEGKEIKQNLVAAYKWFYISALLGNSKSIYQLALLLLDNKHFKKQEQSGMKWLKKSADMGNVDAEYKIANIYLEQKEYKDGLKYLKQCALQGKKEALYELGVIYLQNNFVKRNYENAFKYLRKAADQEYYLAYKPLSLLYKYGYGTQKNKAMASMYKKMAKKKNEQPIE
jgi:TPR repeat protein